MVVVVVGVVDGRGGCGFVGLTWDGLFLFYLVFFSSYGLVAGGGGGCGCGRW